MPVNVAINGFGRSGRLVLRAAFESKRKDIRFVAINDLGTVEDNAYLLEYDTVHGPFPGRVRTTKRSTMSATEVSDWPTPTVSTSTRTK